MLPMSMGTPVVVLPRFDEIQVLNAVQKVSERHELENRRTHVWWLRRSPRCYRHTSPFRYCHCH